MGVMLDTVHPFKLYSYKTVDSTNAVARRAITMMGKEMDMSVHLADEQTEGRGRNGRTWLNTEDAVMMSIVQSTSLGMDKVPILNLVAAAAVKNALMRLTNNEIELTVKWPNDILTSDRLEKVCGILSEVVIIDGKKYAIIGIGVNLNASSMPDDLLQPATSIFLQYGIFIPIIEAVNAILKEFLIQIKLMKADMNLFLLEYAKGCISIGRHVTVNDGERMRYGRGEKLAKNGQLIVDFEDGGPEVIYAADVSVRNLAVMDDKLVRKLIPKRKFDANKGAFGRAGLIVGSDNMPGAALMCTKACIRSGAGLTRVLIPASLAPTFGVVPEAMLISDDRSADDLIKWSTALAIGCGMGVCERTRLLVNKVLLSGKPCVIDADALNTMSEHRELLELLHDKAVITPHPGEMARLCECSVEEVLNRFSPCAIGFASRYGCTVLLKSASSIIVSPKGAIRYNDSGNDGLAKGGSGDVLTGIITGMLAQGAKPFDAASVGSYLLGICAEKAIDHLKNRFIEATDIVDIVDTEINLKEI